MEWLSVRVLLYSMLQEDKEIGYSPEGNLISQIILFISISHTKGYVAVMLASSVPVGIDIEQYAQRVHKVCDRYVRPDEQVESYQGDITWGCYCIGRQRKLFSSGWKMRMLIFVNSG